MTGLIIKDLLVNKKYLQTCLFLIIFYIAYALFPKNLSLINMIIILISSMFVLTTFSYDDFAKWNTYALTMPTTRKYIINSKYVLTIFVASIGSIICFAIQLVFSIIIKKALTSVSYLIIGVCFLAAILFNCIIIPIVVKVGSEKARIVILAVALIPTILLIAINKMGVTLPSNAIAILIPYIPLITIIGSIIIFLSSLFISQRIFLSKEF